MLQDTANTGAGGVAASARQKAAPPHSGPAPDQWRALGPVWAPPSDGFYSPTERLRSDVARAERTGRQLHSLAESVSRRSLRL